MKCKLKAIILGGTNPHIALINNLKSRNYYTILIDYYNNPPAKSVADQHIQESTLDREKVLHIAKEFNAKLVISTCIDQANVTACYVAEKMGLLSPYSYQTALTVSDKLLMKKMMIEGGIPTSQYLSLSENDEIANIKLNFPVIVKPADSTGSKGVRKANSQLEAERYITYAFEISRNGFVICEEYKEGKEVQIDCFIKNKEAKIIMIRQKQALYAGNEAVMQTQGSLIPADISTKVRRSINTYANEITKLLNLENTPLFIQAKIAGDDINIIEFSPRIGGGLSFSIIKVITGFDILDATIDSFLGIAPEIKVFSSDEYYLTRIIYSKPGVFNCIVGFEELYDKKVIEDFYYFKTKGMKIGSDMASQNRVGAFLVKGNNQQELIEKSTITINSLEVYDINNDPIMCKDIYS